MLSPRKTPSKKRKLSHVGSAKSSRRGSVSSSTLSKKRRLSVVSSRSSKSRTSSGNTDSASTDLRHRAMVRRGKRKITFSNKINKIHLTRKFKLKVKKALEPTVSTGYLQKIGYGCVDLYNQNQQAVYPLGYGAGGTPNELVNNQRGWCFTPVQVMDAAGILFDAKTPLTGGVDVNINNTGNFAQDVKIVVKKQWVTVKMLNNSQVPLIVKLIKMKPKNIDQVLPDFSTTWSAGLTREYDTGSQVGANVTGIATSTLYNMPHLVKDLTARFTFEVDHMKFEPGQESQINIQGPSMTYDFRKFYKDSNFQNQQKMCMQLNFIVYSQLVSSLSTNTYVARAPRAKDGFGFIHEISHHYSLEMPDKAGWLGNALATTAGSFQQLSLRRDAYAIVNLGVNLVGANTNEVLEEQPATGLTSEL